MAMIETTDQPSTYEIGQHIGFVDLIDRAAIAQFPESKTAKWFCAVTNPNCQARAALGLHEIGYRTFYPKARRWVTHARVKKAKETPLLGRYIFVEVDHPTQSFGAVRAVNGIEALICHPGPADDAVYNPRPVEIPAGDILRLRERYMAGEWDSVANETIPIGATVKLMEGEFADMLATVTAKEGRKEKMIVFKLQGENRYGRLHLNNVRAA